MKGTKYLVDNNALGPLGDKCRRSAFFKQHCRVPEEVAHESRRAKHAPLLAPITVEMDPAILVELAAVMKTVPVGDTRLVDLYNNKGAADPILVAMAHVLSTENLFSDRWVIVTKDEAVKEKAKEFSIETVTPESLAALIDDA